MRKYHLKGLLLISQELIGDVFNKLFPFSRVNGKNILKPFQNLKGFGCIISCFNFKNEVTSIDRLNNGL